MTLWKQPAALLLACALAAPAAPAAERPGRRQPGRAAALARPGAAVAARVAPLVVHPLASAPRLAPSELPQPSGDPRVQALAAVLRERLPALRARARAERPVVVGGAQRDDLERLRARVGNGLRVRMHARTRTPRFLQGPGLQRAVAGARADAPERTARAFLRDQRRLLRLDDPDRELVLRRSERDALGRTHLRFRQRFEGLDVEPAELLVHLDGGGDVDVVNGRYAPTPDALDVVPSLPAASAVRAARAAAPGGAAAAVALPRLLVWAPGDAPARLAWEVSVAVSLAQRWRVVVDAHDGTVVTLWNTAMDVDVAGSGTDLFGANQPIHVWQEGGVHALVDTSRPMFDASSDPPDPDTTRGAIVILDARNQPATNDPQAFPQLFQVTSLAASEPAASWVPDGVSALVNFARVYDYYRNVHDRNSLDANGGSILAVVRLGVSFANAFFLSENNLMAFGDAEDYAGALDVVAHELTHGVTFHSANLIYQNEPGALNEAMSDIFGEMVEFEVSGGPDWLVGSPPGLSQPLRSLADPGAFGDPARYGHYQRLPASQDNGGVHTNSGIINHAFYQLAAGLADPLSISDARDIFYRALTTYLSANSQFVDARLAAVQAAGDLFPGDARRAQRVREAFDAVEIFDGAGTTDPPPFPGTEGSDATIFVRSELGTGGFADFLYREELPADPIGGSPLTFQDVKTSRPSVEGDGAIAWFVDSIDDVCIIPTDGSAPEECLGFPGTTGSLAVSPDGNRFGFVLLTNGQRTNEISVLDFTRPPGQEERLYTLLAPALDGGAVSTIRFADAMDFTADGRFIVFDALTRVGAAGGPASEEYAIYAVDLASGATLSVVPPVPGFDIGYPALAQRSDGHLVFDVVDQATEASVIVAADLNSGERRQIGQNPGGFAVPGYTGDDRAIVFSLADDFVSTGFSLVARPIAADHITPAGAAGLWIEDADFGVVYRRGPFVPEPGAGAAGAAAGAALVVLARRRRQRISLVPGRPAVLQSARRVWHGRRSRCAVCSPPVRS